MPKPLLVLGADHAGFMLKEIVKRSLVERGFEVRDLSPIFRADDDYPAVGKSVAQKVTKTRGSRGILVCGSGVGISIAANRIKGARAFDAFDATTVKLAREHNDANIIALSGWNLDAAKAKKLVNVFLKTKTSSAQRHARRVKQLG